MGRYEMRMWAVRVSLTMEEGDRRKKHQEVGRKRMMSMRGKPFPLPIQKRRYCSDAFLAHVVVSSTELTNLKPKGFGKFSVNPASWCLFFRVGAGCMIAHKAKEKPLEYCVIPTVYVVAEWWSRWELNPRPIRCERIALAN